MNKIETIIARFGQIDIFTNDEENILYAVPRGYVGPQLVKKDLQFLKNFDENCKGQWKYVVDISSVKIVYPLNPFLLVGLMDLSKMNEYVVYTPSPIVRMLLNLASIINRPNRIIKMKTELMIELEQYQCSTEKTHTE